MTLPDRRLLRLLPLASLVLTACSINAPKGPGKSPDSPQWRQHQQEVRNLSQYQTRGAFAYLSDSQKVYARFFWQQTGQDNYRLLLTNPLGSTELELNARPGSVELVDNKGQHYTATDAEEMIGKLTGMPIPLNSLRQWILGLPGDATDYKLDSQYRLSELNYTQNGKTWKVTYGGYDTKSTPAMPSNMELNQDGQRIKLKMDNWIVK
ncbi:lipoprotein insertase outer membrane protein LolB [Pseudescherichia vulneris]|uniref:lipoprotein insertase outer membrane protein LolB n=1 Tax=Pseudescherichia vulneris TaxID=566 RepID=UPI00227BA25E|nr:lipoprotein insertase outer membrane protein LolB [Pseudescherichia vulneris]WAH52664.1 lipoprotein insertase outer membrane protein LolB [Pseudescherichia vulneris]